MRIIGGKWKGKALHTPEGTDIRPTSSRSREALFNILMHLPDNPLADQPILDLCCGTGALGLEALSRGASHCYFIDNASASLALTKRNGEALGAGQNASYIQANASALPVASTPVSLIMIDPPYQHTGLVLGSFTSLRAQGWLREGSLFCVEQSTKNKAPEIADTDIVKQRRYGRSEITLYRFGA